MNAQSYFEQFVGDSEPMLSMVNYWVVRVNDPPMSIDFPPTPVGFKKAELQFVEWQRRYLNSTVQMLKRYEGGREAVVYA